MKLATGDQAPSGLAETPTLKWGTHVAHMFETAEDLRDVLAPYFKAGLENNERCLWVTDEPLRAAEARAALRALVPDLDEREARGQIEIQDGDAFYDPNEALSSHDIVQGLVKRADQALVAGYVGLRTNGNCAWVDRDQWPEFQAYEALVQRQMRGRRLICMCSYRSRKLIAREVEDVSDRHDLMIDSAA